MAAIFRSTLTLVLGTTLCTSAVCMADVQWQRFWLKDTGMTGSDAYEWFDGARYDGEWRSGKPHGRGRAVTRQGDVYDGEWKDGLPDGRGEFQGSDGDRYKGRWKSGRRDGHGVHFTLEGVVYQGQWKNDERDGEGVLIFPSGLSYEGEWQRGRKSGRGETLSADGSGYAGEYLDNVPHGHGIERLANGDLYRGTFSRGKRHGVGECTEAGATRTCVFNRGYRVTQPDIVARAKPTSPPPSKARPLASVEGKPDAPPKVDVKPLPPIPDVAFSKGIALTWSDRSSGTVGRVDEPMVFHSFRDAMLYRQLNIACDGYDMTWRVRINGYEGPGVYAVEPSHSRLSFGRYRALVPAGTVRVEILEEARGTLHGRLVSGDWKNAYRKDRVVRVEAGEFLSRPEGAIPGRE